jgi:hypothetical protein
MISPSNVTIQDDIDKSFEGFSNNKDIRAISITSSFKKQLLREHLVQSKVANMYDPKDLRKSASSNDLND